MGHPIATNGDFVAYVHKSAWGDRVVVCGGEQGWPRDGIN